MDLQSEQQIKVEQEGVSQGLRAALSLQFLRVPQTTHTDAVSSLYTG